MAEKHDAWIGTTLTSESQPNSYLLEKKLGAGAFGAVYAATEKPSGKKTAVKLLLARHVQNESVTQRFLQEFQVAQRLEHPDAIQFYATGKAPDGTLWLAMEFVPGESLEDYLKRRGPLSIKDTLSVLSPVCEVLEEAHAKGIIHRDLKPQNLMVVELGRRIVVKVLDFGISKLSDGQSKTATGVSMGTPRFMPPEQWESAKRATPQTDLYSLGMIAYQCLAGRLPFDAESVVGWAKAHAMDDPKPLQEASPNKLPDALCEVVIKSISKLPQDRFASALAFKKAFEAASGISFTELAPEGKAPPPVAVTASSVPASVIPTMPIKASVPINTASSAPKANSKTPLLVGGVLAFGLSFGYALVVLLGDKPKEPIAKVEVKPVANKTSAPVAPTSKPAPSASLSVPAPSAPCELRLSGLKPQYQFKEPVSFSVELKSAKPMALTILNLSNDGSFEVFTPSRVLAQQSLSPNVPLSIPTSEMLKESFIPLAGKAREGFLVLAREAPEVEAKLKKLPKPASAEDVAVKAALAGWLQEKKISALCEVYQSYTVKE